MANRIFVVRNNNNDTVQNSLQSLEIYKDISTIAKQQKVQKNVNVNAIQRSIHNCFTWKQGERILMPDFGSDLDRYLYNGINSATAESITASIREIISKWEPRVQIVEIQNVRMTSDTEDNTIHLRIVYSIPSLNTDELFYYMYN